jgi:hypothetical protein
VLRDAPQDAYLNLGGDFPAALMHLTEAQVAIIRAWAAATEWERHLTDGLGQTVHICDFLRNEATRAACGECSVTLYPTT